MLFFEKMHVSYISSFGTLFFHEPSNWHRFASIQNLTHMPAKVQKNYSQEIRQRKAQMDHRSENKLRQPKIPDLKVLEEANAVSDEIASKVANINALRSHYQGELFRVEEPDAGYVAKLLHTKLPPGFSAVATRHVCLTADHPRGVLNVNTGVQVYPNSVYNQFCAWMGWFDTTVISGKK